MKKKLITVWLLLIAGVVGYSQKNTNQPDPNNITIDREAPCREFMMEVFPDKGNCSAQILNVSVDYLVGNSEEKNDDLDNIELLFRMNSKGLTSEEKAVFKKELIEFMEERKKAFDKGL